MNELFVQYNDVYKCIVDPDEYINVFSENEHERPMNV